MARSRSDAWLLGLLAAAILALGLWEVWLRITLEQPPGFFAFPEEPRGESAVQVPHPTRLYAYQPGFRGTVIHTERSIAFHTNAHGFRDRPFDDEAGGRRILALGSSFTVGWGLDADAAWPAQLERELNRKLPQAGTVRVLNAALSGYSLEQMRITAEELLPELVPGLLVAGVSTRTGGWIAAPRVTLEGRVMNAREASRLMEDGDHWFRTVFDAPALRRADFWLAHNFLVGSHALRAIGRFTDTPPDPKAYQEESFDERLIVELERLHGLARGAGVPLVVLPINFQRKDGKFPGWGLRRTERILEYCRSHDLVCPDPTPILERKSRGEPVFRQGMDIHWSAEAHRIAAAELAAALAERGLLPTVEEGA